MESISKSLSEIEKQINKTESNLDNLQQDINSMNDNNNNNNNNNWNAAKIRSTFIDFFVKKKV